MKLKLLNPPKGFSEDAEYRSPLPDEWAIHPLDGMPCKCERANDSKHIVLTKIKTYREPVLPADKLKKVEFSDDGKNWTTGELYGYNVVYEDGSHFWLCDSEMLEYGHCRIEVEPDS